LLPIGTVALLLAFGLPLGLALLSAGHRARFALTIAAFAVIDILMPSGAGRVLHEERTFFGTHRVSDNPPLRVLIDGTTMHGAQSIVPGKHCDPVTYYSKTGPIGQLFASIEDDPSRFRIAAIGLGAAALSAYARPNQQWTFFEINPAIVRIAENPSYFTYLRDCIQHYQVVVGDARLKMVLQPDQQFDLMLFDAFSSDAIPMHLMTREAFALYARKLAPRGVLVFHISNRYLELSPVLGDLARDAGLSGFVEYDADVTPEDLVDGKLESEWAIVARHREDFGDLIDDARWEPLDAQAAGRVWTDDYSNILSTLRFRSESLR
jgi:SAM-dependent methyltransferase